MGRAHVIGRTEKVKQLRDLLKETQIVYISSFFYSGKTMLLNQLAQSQNGPVLFFSAGQDDWPAFVRAAKEHPDALLIVDDLQYLTTQVALPILCGLLLILCLLLFGKPVRI